MAGPGYNEIFFDDFGISSPANVDGGRNLKFFRTTLYGTNSGTLYALNCDSSGYISTNIKNWPTSLSVSVVNPSTFFSVSVVNQPTFLSSSIVNFPTTLSVSQITVSAPLSMYWMSGNLMDIVKNGKTKYFTYDSNGNMATISDWL